MLCYVISYHVSRRSVVPEAEEFTAAVVYIVHGAFRRGEFVELRAVRHPSILWQTSLLSLMIDKYAK